MPRLGTRRYGASAGRSPPASVGGTRCGRRPMHPPGRRCSCSSPQPPAPHHEVVKGAAVLRQHRQALGPVGDAVAGGLHPLAQRLGAGEDRERSRERVRVGGWGGSGHEAGAGRGRAPPLQRGCSAPRPPARPTALKGNKKQSSVTFRSSLSSCMLRAMAGGAIAKHIGGMAPSFMRTCDGRGDGWGGRGVSKQAGGGRCVCRRGGAGGRRACHPACPIPAPHNRDRRKKK